MRHETPSSGRRHHVADDTGPAALPPLQLRPELGRVRRLARDDRVSASARGGGPWLGSSPCPAPGARARPRPRAWLESEHGFHRLAFADPIRRAVLELFPKWNALAFAPQIKDRLCTHYGLAPRAALRAFGEEHARSLDPLIYIKHMEQRARRAAPGLLGRHR
ncbi:MAG: hypothetical protein MZV65_28430 [Chromatiales bacterium]|nr:hypothetical protein [Chromatiales bacterium]